MFALVAVLGFTQNLYGFDLRFSSSAPLVQIHVVVFDSMPRVSWRKFISFVNSLVHGAASHDEACRDCPDQAERHVG